MEVFVKQNAQLVTKLVKYTDYTVIAATFQKYGKGVYLCVGRPTSKQVKQLLVKMILRISVDELGELINVLSNIRNVGDKHFHIIGTGKNWKKEDTRLALQSSEYGGLELARFHVVNKIPDVVEVVDEDEDPDPVPVAEDNPTEAAKEWVKDFERFFISKKDDCAAIASKLRLHYGEIKKLLAIDNELDSPPPPPGLSKTAPPSKRKQGKTPNEKPPKKRKSANSFFSDEDDEVCNIHEGLATIFKFMLSVGMDSPRQCVLMHEKAMNEYKRNNYIELIEQFDDNTLIELCKKCSLFNSKP